MSALIKILDLIIDALMWIGCICCALMMGHIAIDVACRNLLNAPLDGTLEVVASYYMVAIAFLPLAYVSRGEGQIFVDLFTRHLRRRSCAALDTTIYFVTTVYLGFFAWRSIDTALEKTRQGEVWESAGGYLSVWPSRWILVIGIIAMALCTLRLAIAGLTRGADGLEAIQNKYDDHLEETGA